MTAFTFVTQKNGNMAMVCLDNVAYIEARKEGGVRIHFIAQTGHMDTDTTMQEIYEKLYTVESIIQVTAEKQEGEQTNEETTAGGTDGDPSPVDSEDPVRE